MVTHIGFQLFDRVILDGNSDAQFFHFVERYLLELMLLDENDLQAKLRQQRVRLNSEIHPLDLSFRELIDKVLAEPGLVSSVQVSRNKNRYSVICYKDGQKLLWVNFPANRELITSFTKLEAEQALFLRFGSFLTSSKEECAIDEEDLQAYQDSLFHTSGDIYINEEFVSTAFYKKQGAAYKAVIDDAYPVESAYNLFNAQHADSTLTAKVLFSLYAGETTSYELPLCHLSNFLRQEGCQIYTGIKKLTRTNLESTVMAVNPVLGYHHMLIVSTNRDILVSPDKRIINVKMYCYIPMHNVTTLMGK